MQDVTDKLDQLERDGYVLIEGALSPQETELVRQRVDHAREMGWEEGLNAVGNMWFDSLLDREPETFAPLVGHPSVRPYLEGMMGKQCQLRSLRAHINPGPYLQEWHMDFYDFYYQKEKAEAQNPTHGLCLNSTFYLTDNTPDRARLTFVKNYLDRPVPEELIPFLRYTEDRSDPFQRWCDDQELEHLHPLAGDAVVFYSHIPHQGAKIGPDPEGEIRANIVLHYQQNPMFPGIKFVSEPQFTLETLGYAGTFPFAGQD